MTEASAAPATPASPESVIETDALVVGAGPVGLFQVFELGLLGLRAQVVDALPTAGGQCIALYADKPIYDIPGTPVCSARELIERLLLQIKPFEAGFHFGQQVDRLRREADGRFLLETSAGARFLTQIVVIAGGVGSFQPRRLKLDGIAAFEGSQLFYSTPEPQALADRQVLVIGDGDAAIDCALDLAQRGAATVTLMHRRDEFKARATAIEALRAARAAGRIGFIAAQPTGIAQRDGRLTGLTVLGADGTSRTVAIDTLIVLTGLSPKLGPIADWGLALERKQLVVDTGGFQTSVPGIFAVGDVNTYPGKKKLILCGFHEAALAAFAAAAIVFPERPPLLEYTTTSPRLQRALGVARTTSPPSET